MNRRWNCGGSTWFLPVEKLYQCKYQSKKVWKALGRQQAVYWAVDKGEISNKTVMAAGNKPEDLKKHTNKARINLISTMESLESLVQVNRYCQN